MILDIKGHHKNINKIIIQTWQIHKGQSEKIRLILLLTDFILIKIRLNYLQESSNQVKFMILVMINQDH